MRRKIFTLLLLAASVGAMGQGRGEADWLKMIDEIEENSLALKAAKAGNKAAQTDNRTELTLPDPEVTYSYMWGTTAETPNRTNVEVTQTFDWATISGAKRREARGKNNVLDKQLRVAGKDIRLQAAEALVEMAYANQLKDLLQQRHELYKTVDAMAEKALNDGNMTAIDHNKLHIERVVAEGELEEAKLQCITAKAMLDYLNGKAFEHKIYDFPQSIALPSVNEYAKEVRENADIEALNAEVEAQELRTSVSKKQSLPNITAGYVNELVQGANYHGFTVGLSIPLWGNRNAVKASKAAAEAARENLTAEKKRIGNDAITLYIQAQTKKKTIDEYAKALKQSDGDGKLLDKALASGTLTVHEYIDEREALAAQKQKLLEMQRDYYLTLFQILRMAK